MRLTLYTLTMLTSSIVATSTMQGMALAKVDNNISYEHPTVDAFVNAVQKITPNVILGSQQCSERIISKHDIETVLNESYHTMRKELETTMWVGDQPHTDSLFFAEKYPKDQYHNYMPFIEKRIVSPEYETAIHGDIHGDIFSATKALQALKNDGYIDNTFKIIKDNVDIIYLGDYGDGGQYGIECMYGLLRLYLANPKHVKFMRGNHEDVDVAKSREFFAEFELKYPDSQQELKNSMFRLHDFMPIAYFVGVKEAAGFTSFILYCHAGLEHRYAPGKLLDSQYSSACELLPRKLNVLEALRKHLTTSVPPSFYEQRTLQNEQGENSYSTLGFMWNDFTVDPAEPISFDHERGWKFNKAITEAILRAQSTPTSKIRGVFRGHQHNKNPQHAMMQSIYNVHGDTPQHCGISKLWKGAEEQGFNSTKLWDNIVATFSVCPDVPYYNSKQLGQFPLKFHAFGILTTKPRYEDWELKVVRFAFPDEILPAESCKALSTL